jgi:tRNA(Ile)-lysidine synthase
MPEGGSAAVALSGGRDSVVLLDAAAAIASVVRVRVHAIHVHHGLSLNADRWSSFCADFCAARGVPLSMRRVTVERRPRVSLEAAARDARYAALADAARESGLSAVLLAHHADDQAETLLLQLLRGAGPRGLCAMPASRLDRGLAWLRPLLGLPRADIDACAALQGLAFIEDESNASPAHRRNALRLSVVPALRALAPGYPLTLLRAAELQAEAVQLADDLAAIDAQSASDGRTLGRAALAALPPHRARNLLRAFLRSRGLPAPSAARLDDMLRQLAHAASDARTAIACSGVELGVHRGRISVHPPAPATYVRAWTGAPVVELPHGTLVLVPARGEGIAARHLTSCAVTIRSGTPGERLLRPGRVAHRAVADLLREAGIAQWDRRALPRIYCGAALAAVAGVGVDAAFAAASGEPARVLEWRPGAVPGGVRVLEL